MIEEAGETRALRRQRSSHRTLHLAWQLSPTSEGKALEVGDEFEAPGTCVSELGSTPLLGCCPERSKPPALRQQTN